MVKGGPGARVATGGRLGGVDGFGAVDFARRDSDGGACRDSGAGRPLDPPLTGGMPRL